MMNGDDALAIRDLEAFVLSNDDLERLEALIAEFNIFEALGAVHHELRHSDFLAFLLDPNANHGLGDSFLKRFLMRVLMDANDPPLNPIRIDLISMDQAVIRREWQNIDIFIEDPLNNLVVIIENKILSGEHDRQLKRYYGIVQSRFPRASIVPVFLTPDGIDPSEDCYIPVGYNVVADVLKVTLERDGSILGPDVQTLISHYATMLRRYIVSDSEIAELCQRIYRRHQKALDLIYEHRPDMQLAIFEFFVEMLQQREGIELDHSTKTAVRFHPAAWDDLPALNVSDGKKTWPLLIFEIRNDPTQVRLRLFMTPGPNHRRQTLFDLAKQNSILRRAKNLAPQYHILYTADLLKKQDMDEATMDDLTPKIDQRWRQFLDYDLHQINDTLMQLIP